MNRRNYGRARLAFVLLTALVLAAPARAQENAAEFYRGKTIQVINPFAEAGLYAFLAQLLAEHLPKHLPACRRCESFRCPAAAVAGRQSSLQRGGPRRGPSSK